MFSQNEFFGIVYDSLSSERLVGANIFIPEINKGVVSNEFGHFMISTNKSNKAMVAVVSFIGYVSDTLILDEELALPLGIPLLRSKSLELINIVSSPIKNDLGYLDIETLKLYPTALESDIIKSIHALPGIQITSEGQSNFVVRGGNSDQNLILLDNVPIYSPTHGLGFISSINSDIVKSLKLKKEGIPAQYGGRISSVLDVTTRDGDLTKLKGEVGLGLLSSKFVLEGPLCKKRTSFLFSARRSYLDLILLPFKNRLFENSTQSKIKPSVYFYDMNLKIKHLAGDKHEFVFNGYISDDLYNVKYTNSNSRSDSGLNWKNYITSLRWSWKMSPSMFLKSNFYSSTFRNQISNFQEVQEDEQISINSLQYLNFVKDYAFKTDLEYLLSDNFTLNSGVDYQFHQYNTGSLDFYSKNTEIVDATLGNQISTANELNIYSEINFKQNDFALKVGLRNSLFSSSESLKYALLPRLKFQYSYSNFDMFLTYDKTVQFINQLISSSITLPTDIWVPTPSNLSPQKGNQFTIGTNVNLLNKVDITILAYYKIIGGLLSYKEGENFITTNDLNPDADYDWEEKIVQGLGKSKGVELLVQKKMGKVKGFLSYSLSKATRKFKELNNGDSFPFKYDRTHDITLSLLTPINKKINVSGSWNFSTGIATTLPYFRYPVAYQVFYNESGEVIHEQYPFVSTFGQKNAFRLSNYHRLDVQINYKITPESDVHEIVFGLYNLYFRRNPYIVESSINNNGESIFEEISLIPFAIPTIIYKYKF